MDVKLKEQAGESHLGFLSEEKTTQKIVKIIFMSIAFF
jgi:hypothetical protein